MEDQSSEGNFTFSVTIKIPEAHGQYRASLQRYFGLMTRVILLTREGYDFRKPTPSDRLKIDLDSQGMAFMLDSTFDWLQSLGLLIDLRNQASDLSLDDSTPEGIEVILSGYEHAFFHHIIDEVHQLGEVWKRLGEDLDALGEPVVLKHYRQVHDTFVMFTDARDALQHIVERYPNQEQGHLLFHSQSETLATWGFKPLGGQSNRGGVYQFRRKNGTETRLHLTAAKLNAIKQTHVEMVEKLDGRVRAFFQLGKRLPNVLADQESNDSLR